MADPMQPNPIDMIREDHEVIKRLFREFEQASQQSEKKRIVDETLIELQTHSKLEEQIFYPFVRRQSGDNGLINESEEEHHAADILIMELAQIEPDNPHYDAKYKVLSETVKMHMQEEESKVLPLARQAGEPKLSDIGRQMAEQRGGFKQQARDMVGGSIMETAKNAFEQIRVAMGKR